ncbi:MAG: hypothetical protein KME15_17730 [Drouetiella hepatica Uher 2000/2452]|jgi:hypothetical protein|uniref:Uncharacterized protein n=1 Tax=Drouetiella hepatica Uher 2000/2452 TaxID=904376 RepID=A0A951UNJ3_9CYAN|nr:hypothetical protein [Drouetiella hepatica Uher 2000/2452]
MSSPPRPPNRSTASKQRKFRWTKQLSKLRRWDIWLVLFLLLLWVAVLLGSFVWRGSYIFEGNLIVQEMGFTYAGDTERRFLSTIRRLKKLDIEGSQPQPLVLTGKFSSSDPMLNQKLSQRDRLAIEFPYADSRLIFTPVKESELAILEARIQPATQINQLKYQAQPGQPAQLSFCLQSVNTPLETCQLRSNLPDTPTSATAKPLGTLKLQLGQQPLALSIERFNIPELGIKTDISAFQSLDLQFTPSFDESTLSLLSPTRLFIDLPDFAKAANSEKVNLPQWLWGDFDVQDVRFSSTETTEVVTDELPTSTILLGEVQMQRQSLQLKENQFLIIASKPGIRKLRYIQIHPQSPQGLQTLVSGESQGIKVGLYPQFPIQSIEPSWLSKHFSQEAINAILAFIAALTGVLLPRLFPEPPKQP